MKSLKELGKSSLGSMLLSLILFGGVLLASPIQAEELEPVINESYTLPVITVTANKRVEDAQEIPIAMQVITAQDIEDAGIETMDQIYQRIPNLYVGKGTNGTTNMSYRGAASALGTKTNPVLIYVDDVPLDSFALIDVNLANIERIEILKGAQSVIYGKNAFGAIIRIVTKKPTNELDSHVYTQVNQRGGFQLGGTVSGPIVEDILKASLSLSTEHERGFQDALPGIDKQESSSYRAKGQLYYTPTQDTEFNLLFDYNDRDEDRPQIYYSPNGKFSDVSEAGQDDFYDSYSLNLALKGSVDFDALTAESLTTYRQAGYDSEADWTNFKNPALTTALGAMSEVQDEITQEFRIRSNDDAEGLKWLFGVYGGYTDWELYDTLLRYKPYVGGNDLFGPANIITKEFSAFGKVEYPFADSWNLALGLRYFDINREADLRTIGGGFPAFGIPDFNLLVTPSGNWSEFLPSVNLSYNFDDSKMVYAGVSRSALPGGINFVTVNPADKLIYDSQTAWNYELGAKTQWLNNKLRINPVLFYIIYEDLQELLPTLSAGGGFNFSADNPAKKSTAYGIELDMAYLITPELQLDANFGYTHAVYDDYEKIVYDALGTSSNFNGDGNRMMLTPEFTGRVGAQWRHAMGFFLRGDLNYFGEFYWDAANTIKRDAVVTVDARIGYEAESFDIYAYGRNILGEEYVEYLVPSSMLAYAADTGLFGLEFTYRF